MSIELITGADEAPSAEGPQPLVRLGILSSTRLRQNRRVGYGLCLISAVLLPGVDFVTMALQALPILVLFEGSIWAAIFFEKRWAERGVLGAPLAGTTEP